MRPGPTRARILPVSIPTQPENLRGPRWSQEQRLEFIDFRLRWEGRLNRSDLTEFFGISVPQASLDLARYLEAAPGNAVYDRRARVYVAGPEFRSLYQTDDAAKYMNELLARATGLPTGSSFMGWVPPMAVTPVPGRAIDANTLFSVLRAIREGEAMSIVYQSMSRPEPQSRTISPHALAHDGFRWHARAFCHTRLEFRDFVIGRMLRVEGMEQGGADPATDKQWHTMVSLALGPSPRLNEAHRRSVELDYGMIKGQVRLECRQALLFYVLRHLGLDDVKQRDADKAQVVLVNTAEVATYL